MERRIFPNRNFPSTIFLLIFLHIKAVSRGFTWNGDLCVETVQIEEMNKALLLIDSSTGSQLPCGLKYTLACGHDNLRVSCHLLYSLKIHYCKGRITCPSILYLRFYKSSSTMMLTLQIGNWNRGRFINLPKAAEWVRDKGTEFLELIYSSK